MRADFQLLSHWSIVLIEIWTLSGLTPDLSGSPFPEAPVRILKKAEMKRELRFTVSDDMELECKLSRANAVTSWYKDGRRVEDDERFCQEEEGVFRSLVVLSAELADGGEYVLDVGDDSVTFLVTVDGKPDLCS